MCLCSCCSWRFQATYITKLGFYSDDWTFLAALDRAPDQTIAGLFINALNNAHTPGRPLHILETVFLYRLFGFDPFWDHIINGSLDGWCAALLRIAAHARFATR